jgi:hypothetical protein
LLEKGMSKHDMFCASSLIIVVIVIICLARNWSADFAG